MSLAEHSLANKRTRSKPKVERSTSASKVTYCECCQQGGARSRKTTLVGNAYVADLCQKCVDSKHSRSRCELCYKKVDPGHLVQSMVWYCQRQNHVSFVHPTLMVQFDNYEKEQALRTQPKPVLEEVGTLYLPTLGGHSGTAR